MLETLQSVRLLTIAEIVGPVLLAGRASVYRIYILAGHGGRSPNRSRAPSTRKTNSRSRLTIVILLRRGAPCQAAAEQQVSCVLDAREPASQAPVERLKLAELD